MEKITEELNQKQVEAAIENIKAWEIVNTVNPQVYCNNDISGAFFAAKTVFTAEHASLRTFTTWIDNVLPEKRDAVWTMKRESLRSFGDACVLMSNALLELGTDEDKALAAKLVPLANQAVLCYNQISSK